jgi:hypothetical protein
LLAIYYKAIRKDFHLEFAQRAHVHSDCSL